MLRRALAAEAAAVETWWKGCGVASRRLSTSALPRACVTNLKTLNYDNGIDLTRLSKVADVTSHDYSTTEEIIERTKGFDVAITKEVPVTADTIAKLDPSIKIICEAGTGFNNIDLEAAKAKGITVTNVPGVLVWGIGQSATALGTGLRLPVSWPPPTN